MLLRRFIAMGALVFVVGCGVVAGVQDLEYGARATTTETAPNEPSAESGTTSTEGPPVESPLAEPADPDAAADAPVKAGDEPLEDAGPGALPGCTVADFLANDRRGPNQARTIALPVAGQPAQYAPRCMMIRAGQSVTWLGDLAVDPLAARSQNPPSPITLTGAGTTVTFTFAQKGFYRYGSTANLALRGALEVRP